MGSDFWEFDNLTSDCLFECDCLTEGPLNRGVTVLLIVLTYPPQFIIEWKEKYALNTWCENVRTREKKKLWRRKDRKSTDAFQYPWKEINQEK